MHLAVISPFPPKLCGIANFSAHLDSALIKTGGLRVEPVEMIGTGPEQQVGTIRRNILDDYARAAHSLNQNRPDAVLLQHEYGLFGGTNGGHVLELIRRLHSPLVTVLHTVLPNPDPTLREVTAEIVARSSLTIVMCRSAATLLLHEYEADSRRVDILPHGSPEMTRQQRPQPLLSARRPDGPVILAIGLLGPDKGIQTAISAMRTVLAHFPAATLWVVGATHPGEIHSGVDGYRRHLLAHAQREGVQDAVQFVNEYLTLEEHIAWIQHADLVLTLHRDARQVSSGTLTYAVGFGRAVVSTPFAYALELADAGAGVLVTTPDAANVDVLIVDVLSDSQRRRGLMTQSAVLAPSLTWRRIADSYRAKLERL